MVHLVQFIDEQDARPFVLQSAKKWSCAEELLAL
jgi:hypothetical protein